MKIIPASLACLLFASLPFAPRADAQDTVHSVYGDRRANTPDDLQKAITQLPYTWEIPDGKSAVTFNGDGTGRQTFFNFTWKVKNAQEIELSMPGSPSKAVIKFSSDYATYTGTDFDGARPIHGSVVIPPKAPVAPQPQSPPVAAATPLPAPAATPPSSNPFLDEHTTGGDANGALEKAIVNSTYTWEPEGDSDKTVTFLPGGVGQNTFFKITWRIKGPHELEIGIPDGKTRNKIVMRFNSDFTKYTATDFDGESKLKGHKMKPGEN